MGEPLGGAACAPEPDLQKRRPKDTQSGELARAARGSSSRGHARAKSAPRCARAHRIVPMVWSRSFPTLSLLPAACEVRTLWLCPQLKSTASPAEHRAARPRRAETEHGDSEQHTSTAGVERGERSPRGHVEQHHSFNGWHMYMCAAWANVRGSCRRTSKATCAKR